MVMRLLYLTLCFLVIFHIRTTFTRRDISCFIKIFVHVCEYSATFYRRTHTHEKATENSLSYRCGGGGPWLNMGGSCCIFAMLGGGIPPLPPIIIGGGIPPGAFPVAGNFPSALVVPCLACLPDPEVAFDVVVAASLCLLTVPTLAGLPVFANWPFY